MESSRLQGLYVITDPQLLQHKLLEATAEAIAGGAGIVQYRNKTASPSRQAEEAQALQKLCLQQDVLLIINDDPQLARQVNAHGVHVGQQDTAIQAAREILGADKIIGVSCNNKLELALAADRAGADYIAFGRFFPSNTKPNAPQASPSLLQQAREQTRLPIVAIGGITPNNGADLLQAGADMLAVIHDVFAAADIRQAAYRYHGLFALPETRTAH